MSKIVLLTFILSLLSSCVGTVQDASTPLTEIAAQPSGNISFSGIAKAVPIAQDKIEVFFNPATGGSQKFYYYIYAGDKPVPFTAPSETLTQDYQGYYKFTITGLEPAKTYAIKIEAVDQISYDKDTNMVTVNATTFGNMVADFHGISDVSNMPGVEGLDAIYVRWTQATVDYTNFLGTSQTDPKSYEIIAIDSNGAGPGDFDNTADLVKPYRIVKYVDFDANINQVTMRGLKSNTKYYVRVRCLHQGSIVDMNKPELRGEKNSTYFEIKTLDGNLANIKNLDTLKLDRNPGLASASSFSLSWKPITGVYDHLRILYSSGSVTLEPGVSCVPKSDIETSCRKIYGDIFLTIIGSLTTGTTYNFKLVACQDPECNVKVLGPLVTGSPVMTLAGFNGVSSVALATQLQDVGKMFLNFSLPDFTSGDFDGYIVGVKDNDAPANGETGYTKISESDNPLAIKVTPFDFRSTGQIEITGIDYTTSGNYCFTIYPFVFESTTSSNKIGYPNNIWKCAVPAINPPTADDFGGLFEAYALGYDISISWHSPGAGIFENYEIYLKKMSNSLDKFTFQNATTQLDNPLIFPDPEYIQVIVPWYMSSYTFSYLELGNYKVGILTRYLFGDKEIKRSDFNESIYKCTVDASKTGQAYKQNFCVMGSQ